MPTLPTLRRIILVQLIFNLVLTVLFIAQLADYTDYGDYYDLVISSSLIMGSINTILISIIFSQAAVEASSTAEQRKNAELMRSISIATLIMTSLVVIIGLTTLPMYSSGPPNLSTVAVPLVPSAVLSIFGVGTYLFTKSFTTTRNSEDLKATLRWFGYLFAVLIAFGGFSMLTDNSPMYLLTYSVIIFIVAIVHPSVALALLYRTDTGSEAIDAAGPVPE